MSLWDGSSHIADKEDLRTSLPARTWAPQSASCIGTFTTAFPPLSSLVSSAWPLSACESVTSVSFLCASVSSSYTQMLLENIRLSGRSQSRRALCFIYMKILLL